MSPPTWPASAPPRAPRRASSRAPTRRRRTPRCTRWRRRSAATPRSSLAANARDVAAAQAAGHDAAFVDRLALSPATIEAMAAGLEQIAALPDPVGEISDLRFRPSGIQVGHMRVPLGRDRHRLRVAAQRHRRRRGPVPQGRQRDDPARRKRGARAATRRSPPASTRACAQRDCRRRAVQVVATTDRAAVGCLIADEKHVDVIVPRGGKGLIERIAKRSEGAGDQAPRRRLPRLHRRARRSGHGDPHRRQREDAALLAVQHDGDAARPRRHRRARAAAARRDLRGQGRRAARLRALARAGPGDEGGDRERLVHRVPRADPGRAHRRRLDDGDRRTSRSTARSTPTRSSPTTTRRRCASCAKSTRAR